MSQLYDKPLPVGKTGNYTLTVDNGWLNGETITVDSVTVPSGGATVTLPTATDNVIQAYFEGVSVGRHEVHWEYSTVTRSDCYTTYITVVEC